MAPHRPVLLQTDDADEAQDRRKGLIVAAIGIVLLVTNSALNLIGVKQLDLPLHFGYVLCLGWGWYMIGRADGSMRTITTRTCACCRDREVTQCRP